MRPQTQKLFAAMVVFWVGLLPFLKFGSNAYAKVVRFEISSREPFAEGATFGEVGAYERIQGRVYYEISPGHSRNQRIRDLQHAPRNKNGKVEFFADFDILAPKDMSKGNGALLYDVNNRGNKLALRFFNDGRGGNNPRLAADAGHGFLMRQGYTIVWSGWDGELLPGEGRLQLFAPVAQSRPIAAAGAGPITGLVRYEIGPDRDTQRLPVNRANHGAYRPTEAGLEKATLTWRLRVDDPRVPIPHDQFHIEVEEVKPNHPSQLPRVSLVLSAGFRKGYLYELIYEAQDPLVHGVCFAAAADLVSALKYGGGENNPLLVEGKSALDRALGFGVSQSGRFLREMIYGAFNIDEHPKERRALDGMIPHVAGGGLGSFNHRFAQPTAFATQRDLHDWPTDRFPFAYGSMKDPLSQKREGVLRMRRFKNGIPLVMHTQSSTEYWSRSGSLVHTDPTGSKDAEIPSNVRIYAFGGTQHGPASFPPNQGKGQTLANPGDYRPLLRALLVALDQWVNERRSPPDSVYPKIEDGTLVDWRRPYTRFPFVPGVRYPEVIHEPAHLEFGDDWPTKGVMTRQPPLARGRYRVLVPRCNLLDGNEEGCLLPPEVYVPVATYTGWSLRSHEAGAENELVGLSGSFIPLPASKEERVGSGDPRVSVQEKYGSLERYVETLRKHCLQQVKRRYLLAEDVDRIIKRQQDVAVPMFD